MGLSLCSGLIRFRASSLAKGTYRLSNRKVNTKQMYRSVMDLPATSFWRINFTVVSVTK